MDAPEPPPPDASNRHGEHRGDDALTHGDGLILDALDQLLTIMVGLAGAEAGLVETEAEKQVRVASVVDTVTKQWFGAIHPSLYDRLVRLSQLEAGGGGGDSATIASLRNKLQNAESLLEIGTRTIAKKKADIERLEAKEKEDEATIASLRRRIEGLKAETKTCENQTALMGAANLDLTRRLEQSEETKRILERKLKSTPAAGDAVLRTQFEEAQQQIEHLEAQKKTAKWQIDDLTNERHRLTEELAAARGLASEEAEAIQSENEKLRRSNLGLTQRLEASRAETAAGNTRYATLVERNKEISEEREAMEQEIADLEAAKADLEAQLEKARHVHDRVVDLEAEKEELSAQLEEAQEDRDAIREECEEMSETHASELREEIERLRRRLEDEEVEEDEGMAERLAELEETNRELRHEVESARRRSEEPSGGGTVGVAEQRRIAELEQAARVMYSTNEKLLRDAEVTKERLNDLESANRALRHANESVPADLAGVLEENRRYQEQLAQLMAAPRPSAVSPMRGGLSREEREAFESRIRGLELELMQSKKTKQSDKDVQAKLAKEGDKLAALERQLEDAQRKLEIAQKEHKEMRRLPEFPAGTTLEQREKYNNEARKKSDKKYREIEELRNEIEKAKRSIPHLRSKVSRLRNQVELRRKLADFQATGGGGEEAQDVPSEYELEEEEAKRKKLETRLVQARVVGARLLVV